MSEPNVEPNAGPGPAAVIEKELLEKMRVRGVAAAELSACEGELRRLSPSQSSEDLRSRRGRLALALVNGDQEAGQELRDLDARTDYLERRAAVCREAVWYADERIRALSATYLEASRVVNLPLEEMPDVLRGQVRERREAERSTSTGASPEASAGGS